MSKEGHYEIKVTSPAKVSPEIVNIWYQAIVPEGASHIYDDPRSPFSFSFEYIPPEPEDEEYDEDEVSYEDRYTSLGF